MGSFSVNPQTQFVVGYDQSGQPIYSSTFGDMGYQPDPYADYWSQFMGGNYSDPYGYLNYYNNPNYAWDPYGGAWTDWTNPYPSFDPNDPSTFIPEDWAVTGWQQDPVTGEWGWQSDQPGGGGTPDSGGGGGTPGQPPAAPLPGIYPPSGTGVPWPTMSFSTAEPLQMAEQNRIAARGWGQALDQDARDAQNIYQDLEGNFMDWSLYGPGGYSGILGGQAGYTPEQQQNLLQREMLQNALVSGSELEGQYFSPDEYASIYGSPYAARDITTGQFPGMESMQTEAQKRQREGYQYLEGLLGSAVDPNALKVSQAYYPEVQGIIGDTAAGYSDIINPEYLGLSDEFGQNYQVTDRDVQNIKDAAARQIGLRTQAQNESLQRQAANYGNTTPEAIAALKTRAQLYGDQAAADAALQAEMAGRGLLLNTTQQREAMRLGTERDIASRAQLALENLSGQSLSQANLYEQMRRAAEQDISNRLMSTGSEVGQTKLATERDIGQQQQDLARYKTGLISGLTQYGEAEAARRMADLAANRQNVGYQNIATRYNQYMPASQALSSRYGNIYGQQKAEEQEGRGFLSGQQSQAQQGALTSRQQRIQSGATMLSGINQPVSDAIRAKYIPTALDKGIGLLTGFAGG